MNHSLRTADCKTHVRIVAMSLFAGIVVVIGALHMRLDTSGASEKATSVQVITATRQILHSVNGRALVR
jgi:hypothetical protein